MKTFFALASVMLILFLAVPNKIEAQKRRPTKILEGTITGYECGDNCYLTITDKKGKEHTGLCAARPLCTKWNAEAMMPDRYKGRSVKVTIAKGGLLTWGGDVAGAMDAFTTLQFTEAEPIVAQERLLDACTFCGVWEYVDGVGFKHYLKMRRAGASKFKLIEGFDSQGEISWLDYLMYQGKYGGIGGIGVQNADGIYLRPINGRLVGTFVSFNFRPSHGKNITYKVTCELKSIDKLLYSVWHSISSTGKPDIYKYVATKISD